VPHGSAHINSPEIVKQFRNHFVLFDKACRQSLSGVRGDLQKTTQWLQREQLLHWKKELRKREEALQLAKREYERALREDRRSAHSTAVDAKIALGKARRRKEEAETKLQSVKKWARFLHLKTGELMGPCMALSGQLESLTPRALARLDNMVESLEEYLRASPVNASASPVSEE